MEKNKILITYATMSGSTAQVAQAVADELGAKGWQADVRPLAQAGSLAEYGAVVLGAPMILGWHRAALGFLRKNRAALASMPLAIFATAMSLTAGGETAVDGVPVWVDPYLAKPPRNPGRPGLKERYTAVHRYAGPILQAAGPARPVSLAFFGGKLDYRRLNPLAVLFVMLVVQAQPGERRNWPFIRAWAGGLAELWG